MTQLTSFIRSFIDDEEGATMVEYGLMVALIAVVCIIVVTSLGTNLQSVFSKTSSSVGAAAAS